MMKYIWICLNEVKYFLCKGTTWELILWRNADNLMHRLVSFILIFWGLLFEFANKQRMMTLTVFPSFAELECCQQKTTRLTLSQFCYFTMFLYYIKFADLPIARLYNCVWVVWIALLLSLLSLVRAYENRPLTLWTDIFSAFRIW